MLTPEKIGLISSVAVGIIFLWKRNTANTEGRMIKIDVEGAEQLVINGSLKYLDKYAPLIIMEYLGESRANSEHKLAETKLNALGYQAHRIDPSGEIKILKSASKYLEENNLDSDNIVFKKI